MDSFWPFYFFHLYFKQKIISLSPASPSPLPNHLYLIQMIHLFFMICDTFFHLLISPSRSRSRILSFVLNRTRTIQSLLSIHPLVDILLSISVHPFSKIRWLDRFSSPSSPALFPCVYLYSLNTLRSFGER